MRFTSVDGLTIVMVTHNIEIANRGDVVVKLKGGHIVDAM